MNNIKKKFVAFIASAVLMSNAALSVSACPCGANHNCKDKIHTNYPITGTSGTKDMKALGDTDSKNTKSSVYFYCTGAETGTHLQVQVCAVANGNTYYNKTLTSSGKDAKWVTVCKWQQLEIYNSVNEDGFSKCDLKVDHSGSNGKSYRYSFRWSPDTCPSYGSYPIADGVKA